MSAKGEKYKSMKAKGLHEKNESMSMRMKEYGTKKMAKKTAKKSVKKMGKYK